MNAVHEILGHGPARAALRRLYGAGGPHSLLLAGPDGVGRRPLAWWLAALLNCRAPQPDLRPCGRCGSCAAIAAGEHPDVRELAPTATTRAGRQRRRGEITIDRLVRRPNGDPDPLGPWLELRPRYARRVAILEQAESLNVSAANAFLKMLEEPPPWAVMVLIATGPEALLPTVASRCTTVRLGPVDVSDLAELPGHPAVRLGLPGPLLRARANSDAYLAAKDASDRFMASLRGELGAALAAAEQLARFSEAVAPDTPLELLRESLRALPAPCYAAAMDALERCERALEAYVSPQLAFTTLALDVRAALAG